MSLFGDALLRYFSRTMEKPDLPNSSCLVRLYPSFPCHACREGCPHGAIGTGFKKTRGTCQNCGLCAANCPMSAIDGQTNIFTLFRAMDQQRAKEKLLRLVCPATAAEVYPGTVAVACLATLEPAAMLLPALLHFREVWLHHGDCSACPLENNGLLAKRLLHNFAQAALLASFTPETSLLLSPSPPPAFLACRGQQTGYSRRDLLTLLRQQSKRTTQNGAVLIGSLFWEEDDTVVPRRRLWEKLLTVFPGMLEASEALPFARLEISPTCDLCRTCTVLCPTKALSIGTEKTGTNLVHKVSLCVSCGACARYCPQKAISLFPWSGKSWQERILHSIASGPLVPEPQPDQEQDEESWSEK